MDDNDNVNRDSTSLYVIILSSNTPEVYRSAQIARQWLKLLRGYHYQY